MKTKLLTLLAGVAIIFSACSDNENPTDGPEPARGELNGNITESITLDATTEYLMTGAVIVKEGATLTIPAGTTIKAEASGTSVYLLVERGAKIMAKGTADRPVVFTSNAADPKPGDWGGVLINGRAPISRSAGSPSDAATEINTNIRFGGEDVSDNSGILDYVKIEHTGARIDDSAEHNGLTLNGVGNGTTISNIYIKDSQDDAIEFFGGTVNVSNILVVNAEDDMFDFSQGYVGTVSNVYGIREKSFLGVSEDPRGIEADGNLDGESPNDINQSDFIINDITLINEAPGNVMNDVVKIRRGAKATITNLYAAFGVGTTPEDFIDLTDSKGAAHSETVITYTRKAENGLENAANKNEVNATLVENKTSEGASISAFAWTKYNF